MVSDEKRSDVSKRLADVRDLLSSLAFPFPTPSAETGHDAQTDVIHQLDDYILPRYRDLDAPLLAVIGGSTGSGKSTLINAIVREHVAHTSAVRPTTRQPMLMFNPADEAWFTDNRILPELIRTQNAAVTDEPHHHLSLHASESVPTGIALIDSPDIDSFAQENRELAAQLLSAADLWVFVTTAARYADAIPWAMLDDAAERNVVIGVVLNRVPRGQGAEIRPDLVKRLNSRGLGSAPLFMISEQDFDDVGFIHDDDVASLRGWLTAMTRDAGARSAVVRQTLAGAVSRLTVTLTDIHESYGEQVEIIDSLRWDIDDAVDHAMSDIDHALRDGVLLRGEVLARWQDIVGAGTWTRALDNSVGKIRDRISEWFTGKKSPESDAVEAIEEGVHTLLVAQAETAVRQVHTAWQRSGLIESPAPLRSDTERKEEAARIVREWQEELFALVSAEIGGKKATARVLALGVNAIGLALMITVFSATAGLAGGEVAIAGGTAVVAQRVLEAVFGDDAVRRMTKKATESLRERAADFIGEDVDVFRTTLDDLGITVEKHRELAEATTTLRHAYRKESAS